MVCQQIEYEAYNMREKDILDVTIDDLSAEGRGLAKYGNKLVFVRDALPGEEVKAEVEEVHENTKKY